MDTYGKTNTFIGESSFIPFRYQGQYEDAETGLYYNRFRYYDCNDGRYISQDPIGLASGEFGFYNYVEDSNGWIDVFGLKKGVYSNEKARAEAKRLGYEEVSGTSHGQIIFERNDKLKGKNKPKRGSSPKYISVDVDTHNGGVWKGANTSKGLRSKKTRSGTYDANLNRIKD